MEESGGGVVEEMMGLIESIGSYGGGYRVTQRKECLSLVRRLNLMLSLLHELRDSSCCRISDHHHSPMMMTCLVSLKKALFAAKKLLHKCCSVSKIYLALESEAVMASFHRLYDQLNEALDGLPYDELGISHEVKEQVELMRMQLKRAKKRADTQDIELAMDMMVVFSETEEDRNTDSAILERLANKLELHTIADLKQETAAVRKLAKDRSAVQRSESVGQVMDLLRKLKRIEGIDVGIELEGSISSKVLQRCQSSLIPHEFLCPITLEIMLDPVIVNTGQTYERESIQKWLDSDRRTCPKTGQRLKNLSLAPNFALRNLILQWCEKNNFELPARDTCHGSDTSSIEITALVEALSCIERADGVREAVARVRMLSKENPDNRVLIANNGGILPLIYLLSHPDTNIQEQAVTALLNLSIDASNKRIIAREGAITGIIAILRNGTDEARENSAAALFSLSMLEENKALVGALQGIPPLVELLRSGTIRGKKDAATALFNLCMNKGNKSRAIKAGLVAQLVELLSVGGGMVDEGLSIMLLLASHPEGRNEMNGGALVGTLVGIIRNGTAKNKECAASLLLELGHKDEGVILGAVRSGVYVELVEMAKSGTNRARRKANVLLHHISSSSSLDLASSSELKHHHHYRHPFSNNI